MNQHPDDVALRQKLWQVNGGSDPSSADEFATALLKVEGTDRALVDRVISRAAIRRSIASPLFGLEGDRARSAPLAKLAGAPTPEDMDAVGAALARVSGRALEATRQAVDLAHTDFGRGRGRAFTKRGTAHGMARDLLATIRDALSAVEDDEP